MVHRSLPVGTKKGMSDVILVRKGAIYFIEVKSATGKLSKDQKDFKDQVEGAGGYYIIARSVDDILKAGL